MKEKYYISTAITYTSGKPHIGNTYEIVLADAIARFKRLQGYDVYFQTGTDEHGEKIEQQAKKAGISPKEFVDEIASDIKKNWDVMNTSYDRFVRTTDPKHEAVVQHIFKYMYDKGDIYLGKYEGWYCQPDEAFWTDTQIVKGDDGVVLCPECGRPLDRKSEEAYFFKLSKYQKKLEDYIEKHPEFIQPVSRKNEMINNFIKPGLQDLCVSRTSFKWGIPVTFNDKHVVYVWLDALSNYITNIGYDVDNSTEEFTYKWPADLHLIGKDIIRFHTIYWPCFLMSLGIPLPKQVFGHPWLIMSDGKMSKSRGNVVYAEDLVSEFGVDAVRYYFLHEIPFASDGIFTRDLLIERINGDLANILGNLVHRTISMANKYFDGKISNKSIEEDVDKNFIYNINSLERKVTDKMDELQISDAITEVFNLFRASNKYIDDTMPWVLAKDNKKSDRLQTVLYNLLESIRVGAIFLEPFLPDTGKNIFEQLNQIDKTFNYNDKNSYILGKPTPLFMRIDITQ